ncbi:hypothetical protein ACFY0F_29865 [Streptomyces sp. NPDC001544]|uniref:hypothetical protein n=1 Tax=Streptomyces sp. NPDC001544 TaxID=3364584 RepID=UPI003674CBE5
MNHVLCGLAANVALPSELVDRLITIADSDVAREIARRADLGHTQAVALAAHVPESAGQLAGEGRLTVADVDPVTQPDAALALLSERAGPPEWARVLAADPTPERRERLAACPGLPSDVVAALAADPDAGVVAELALWAPADVAARLAEHPRAEVRRAVAANEATPAAVLAALATEDDPPWHGIRQAALENPAAPGEVLATFHDHPSMHLRRPLAARPDLPPWAYERLAADPEPCVRAELAENPALPTTVMRTLVAGPDPDLEVRRGLARNPHVPLGILTRLAGTAKVGATLLPRIAAASTAEVEELAQSPDPAVRGLVAQRRDLPPGVRDVLAEDPDAKVVKSVAPHPGLSEARLRAMVDRHGERVVAAVTANPEASPALLAELAGFPVRKALCTIARHRNATAPALLACLTVERARRIAAGHPALPADAIVKLLTDHDWQVVEAAAANPSLPREVMSHLVEAHGKLTGRQADGVC